MSRPRAYAVYAKRKGRHMVCRPKSKRPYSKVRLAPHSPCFVLSSGHEHEMSTLVGSADRKRPAFYICGVCAVPGSHPAKLFKLRMLLCKLDKKRCMQE